MKNFLILISPLYPILLLISLAAIIVSCVISHDMPQPEDLDARLQMEPVQRPTDMKRFTHKAGGMEYYIEPLYSYELYGLVLSRHTAGKTFFDRAHKRWGDYLNTADLCVVWGDTVFSGVYKEMEFSSGEWTCFYRPKSGGWHSVENRFSENELSNNHMLIANRQVAQTLNDIRIGDQIYFKGYLAEYGTAGRMIRSSSITRTDRGNGACETVFTTDIRILKPAGRIWDYVFWAGLLGIVLIFILWVLTPVRKLFEVVEFQEESLYVRQRRKRR